MSLHDAYPWCITDAGQTRPGSKKAGDPRRNLGRVWQDPVGFRATLIGQAWQPKAEIEGRMRHTGKVPIHEEGAVLREADVVAPQVPMRQALAVSSAPLFLAYQGRPQYIRLQQA